MFLQMSDTAGKGMLKPQKPAPKRAGRKKVGGRKLVQRPKERGKYHPKVDQSSGTKELVKDVAECIFSDEEVIKIDLFCFQLLNFQLTCTEIHLLFRKEEITWVILSPIHLLFTSSCWKPL